jgi:hypothetical protein
MKKKWPVILLISLVCIVLAAIGVYLLRKEIAKTYYGGMKAFSYSYGGGFAGDMREFSVVEEDGRLVFYAKGTEADPFSVAHIVDDTVVSEIRDIIAEQNLFLLNDVDENQDGLADGFFETLNVNFEKNTLIYRYFGTEQRKNIALSEYLMKLVSEPEKDYGELLSLRYGYGAYFAEDWEFPIAKEGSTYLFTATGRNFASLDVQKEVDKSVMEDLQRIINEQKLCLRDGISIHEEDVMDGWSEVFVAEYSTGEVAFGYYGVDARKNEALSYYLLELAGVPVE